MSCMLNEIQKLAKDKLIQCTDDDCINIVKKSVKTIDCNLSLSLNDVQRGLYTNEKEILLKYLPQQVTEEQLKKILDLNKGKSNGYIFKILKETFGSKFELLFK